jgi:hypothetical protein
VVVAQQIAIVVKVASEETANPGVLALVPPPPLKDCRCHLVPEWPWRAD